VQILGEPTGEAGETSSEFCQRNRATILRARAWWGPARAGVGGSGLAWLPEHGKTIGPWSDLKCRKRGGAPKVYEVLC